MFERSRKGENALLIQPHAGGAVAEDVLEEFADLARSAGASVAATLTARIDNLMDRAYTLAQDYATPGRTFWVGLKWLPR